MMTATTSVPWAASWARTPWVSDRVAAFDAQ